MCVRVLRNGDSYSSRYVRNELKPHHYHHHCPYEHKKRGSRPYYKFRERLDRNHESEGGQELVEKKAQSGLTRTKMGYAAFKKKGHIIRDCGALTHADGITPPALLPVELPRVDADDGGGAPDGGGGGGSAVGSSIPISS